MVLVVVIVAIGKLYKREKGVAKNSWGMLGEIRL